MDENALEASLELYKAQLSQVEQAIQAAGSEENADLIQLRGDLQELVSLTEEGLLSLKKSNILKGLEGNGNENNTGDDEYAAFQAAIKEEENSVKETATEDTDDEYSAFQAALREDLMCHKGSDSKASGCSSSNGEIIKGPEIKDITEELAEIVGTLCRAPYMHDWGSSSYHNAMVTDIKTSDDNEIIASVLFCNPTHEGMLPCEYHIEGKCKFTPDQCRYSHGHSVKLEDLREYCEPNYNSLKMESPCLALYTDGLWYRAVIVDVLEEDHQYTVSYDNYNDTATLDLKDILPLHSTGSDSSDEEEESEDKESMLEKDDSSDSSSTEEEMIPRYFMRPNQTTEVLGEWEEHTRGIASKLMAKMGYIVGQGLGKLSQGRSEPVPIQLIPQGKSLDKIMELKEKAGDQDMFNVSKKMKKKKKHGKMTTKSRSETVTSSSDVFHFINKKLGGKKGNIKELIHHHNHKAKNAPVRILEKELSGRSDRNLNIQLLKTEEEIRNTEKEIARLKQALQRHEKKDEGMAKQYRAKLAKTELYLKELKTSEKTIQNHKTKRGNHKKLTVF
ncbi:zinc finger CCCH-type with G patch domain-containing protein-like [Saccostrea echinata]|uniref:zinc finger CCCH-type with G patch domain-containing protein-like n=1 Tax=Saccostrea echinata TaxID=191078 RepID=UPI002A8118E5|nr:zinc finger CCCH-type with G patch domain-containing protein-like [Saccostrea echinata]